ncbi:MULTISPECIES: rod shape-determining protein [unclassified Spiroplasma]
MIKNYVSIDLGTENLVIYSSNRGIVFNEPSVMAYDIKKKSLVAFRKWCL